MSKDAIIVIITLSFILVSLTLSHASKITIGILMTADSHYHNEMHQAFLHELPLQGIDIATVDIIVQKPSANSIAYLNAARRFKVLEVDAIVCYGAPASISALKTSTSIPIIYGGVYEPTAKSIQGDNITGIQYQLPLAPLIRYLEVISKSSCLGVIYNSIERTSVDKIENIKQLNKMESNNLITYDLAQMHGNLDLESIDALLITCASTATDDMNKIIRSAQKKKIVSACLFHGFERKGIILSIFADPIFQGKEVANILADILNGQKPSSIPYRLCNRIKMTINLGEAKNLGLNIPVEMLSTASEIIQ